MNINDYRQCTVGSGRKVHLVYHASSFTLCGYFKWTPIAHKPDRTDLCKTCLRVAQRAESLGRMREAI